MAARDPVGRIWLENADGGCLATVEYAVPEALREPSLLTALGRFLQTRQDHGRWVYGYDGALGDRQPDPDLVAYRYPGDPAWDGPVATVPRPTWTDVRLLFERVLATDGPISVQRVAELYVLTAQAWPEDRR